MPAVLVHGVADTHELWDPVRGHLPRDDLVALDLPGFGCPVPRGFRATKEDYLDWLVAQLDAACAESGEAVDLVGHDWGALLVQRAAVIRPDLVRTLASGGAALEPSYAWHEFARMWQRAETGIETVPTEDPVMAESVLSLYRSAADVFAEWTDRVEDLPSGSLLIWGADDPFVGPEIGVRFAERVGCELLMFEGCGHWWPGERPAEVAAALEELWEKGPQDERG